MITSGQLPLLGSSLGMVRRALNYGNRFNDILKIDEWEVTPEPGIAVAVEMKTAWRRTINILLSSQLRYRLEGGKVRWR
jgi:hypothetical protein